jgi:hypothetical protein
MFRVQTSIREGNTQLMQTVLIVLATIAGLKLAKYLWSIWWENYA